MALGFQRPCRLYGPVVAVREPEQFRDQKSASLLGKLGLFLSFLPPSGALGSRAGRAGGGGVGPGLGVGGVFGFPDKEPGPFWS